MSEFMEFEGKTIDEAIDAACAHFGAQRDRLEVEIVQDAKGGLFGIGGRPALVRARQVDNNAELKALVESVVDRLVEPIVGKVRRQVEIEDERAKVAIQGLEDPGVLIGREGQTLSAIQYLANRIVARRWRTPVRVHIDAGDYRERQDDSLRELALELADKVKSGGRSQATRPLSSYHRRVVHLALQDDEAIFTKSKGDGPMKRVIILPRKGDARARR